MVAGASEGALHGKKDRSRSQLLLTIRAATSADSIGGLLRTLGLGTSLDGHLLYRVFRKASLSP
jgi:hypothetical protein